jgi:AcrR family transcriptional regulator
MKENIEYEKREELLKAAKEEFLEKGYNKASLRTICANAGVTTGALYFFFENKADLFSAIVDGPLNELKRIITRHFDEDLELMSSLTSLDGLDLNHDKDTDIFVDCIYDNYDSFLLLLTGTENTVYENVVDELVDLLEKKIPPMLSAVNGYTYDEFMCHWICHISIDGYIHVIKHERDKEEAKIKLRKVTNFMVQGFVSMGLVKE